MAPKNKKPPSAAPKPPAVPRTQTVRDMIREIYRKDDILTAYHYVRAHSTDLERVLRSAGQSEKLANTLSDKEALDLEAAFSGLKPGRTSLTLPERLVITWSLKAGYTFGGVWPDVTNPAADFFSQWPLEGGRARAGGAVVDVFFSAQASKTKMGVALSVDGVYYHAKVATAARDEAQNTLLISQGYKVARIKDYETYQGGVLDAFMTSLVGKK